MSGAPSPGRFRCFLLRGPSVRNLCEATSNLTDAVLLASLHGYTNLLKACEHLLDLAADHTLCMGKYWLPRCPNLDVLRQHTFYNRLPPLGVPTIDLKKVHQQHCFQTLTIYIDSQSLLKAIERRSPATHHLWSLLNGRPGPTTLLWVPGHKGIPGNELADTEAKAAPTTTSDPPKPIF